MPGLRRGPGRRRAGRAAPPGRRRKRRSREGGAERSAGTRNCPANTAATPLREDVVAPDISEVAAGETRSLHATWPGATLREGVLAPDIPYAAERAGSCTRLRRRRRPCPPAALFPAAFPLLFEFLARDAA